MANTAVEFCSRLVPSLSGAMHKGANGRLAIIGGSVDYTGAPFFSAMATLRMGVDLTYVFCHPDAAIPIKALSPDLMVSPALRDISESEPVEKIGDAIFDRLKNLHAVVIGPGLGRSQSTISVVVHLLQRLRDTAIPIVIDGDGLWVVNDNLDLINGMKHLVLTPNKVELSRLCDNARVAFPADFQDVSARIRAIKQLSQKLEGVTILSKGPHDVVGNSRKVLICSDPSTPRRVGGQGDVLSGAVAAFVAWARIRHSEEEIPAEDIADACYAASFFTRCCGFKAWQLHGRGYLTTDVLDAVGPMCSELFPVKWNDAIDIRKLSPPSDH